MERKRIQLAVVLLMALGAVATAQSNQTRTPPRTNPGLCTPRTGEELVNYGRKWNAWSNESRSTYLEGFVDGQSNTYLLVLSDLPAERREAIRLRTFTFYENAVLRDVMTSLYSDPANSYVRYDSMVYIVRDKIGGKDIEAALRSARQNDCAYTDKK
jgi:hypothetical protein